MKKLVLTLAILATFTLGGVAQSLHYDFEDGTLQGWTTLDGDGDGHNWQPNTDGIGHNGSDGMVLSYSKDPVTGDSLAPNNFIVSPRVRLPQGGSEFCLWVLPLDESRPAEHWAICVSTTVNDDPLAFTTLQEWTLTFNPIHPGEWTQYCVDLSLYAGQDVYIAIRHFFWEGFEVSQSAICIDDVDIPGEIVETQDNSHYADAIQICADGVSHFPLPVGLENAETGPDYNCLLIQSNPSWFFVKMAEPGDVIININVESNDFYDVDFCCWGPFNSLPEGSAALTQDKVVDCSYNPEPATCTIPSEAQTGEYYVMVVTNYANLPGDLIFTLGGGTGSLECPGAQQREWYYEIQNDNGSITYQYIYQAGDTIINYEPTHILVKINTLYDKDLHQDVTHEYIYERNGKVYWWNKELGEFTTLYDFEAEEGDEWEIKVGTQSITVHVDVAQMVTFKSETYRMLTISDPDDIFSGDIVCGIGHLTSFFPERLMDNGDGLRVEGLRCYWIEDELVFKPGDEDCDAIYSEVHDVEEDGPSMGSGTAFTVYPNPTNGVLFVETHGRASTEPNLPCHQSDGSNRPFRRYRR